MRGHSILRWSQGQGKGRDLSHEALPDISLPTSSVHWTFKHAVSAEPWQAFVVFVFLEDLLPLGIGGFLSAMIGPPRSSDSVGLMIWGIATAVMMVLFLSWHWGAGLFLLQAAPERKPSDLPLFRFAAIFPILYALVVPALFLATTEAWKIQVLLPLHLVAIGCIAYVFKVIARSLTLVETGEWKPFREYAGTFLLVWFFPIGVWTIQRRINKIYATQPDRFDA